MHKGLLFESLDFSPEKADAAFGEILDWMDDIGMTAAGNRLYDTFITVLKENNPFELFTANKYYSSPTQKIVLLACEEAERLIKVKYPDAVVKYSYQHDEFKFDIDDATYFMAREETQDE